MALPRLGLTTPLDRARKGRHPPRTRRRRERDLGSLGQDTEQARLADRGGHVARGVRALH